MIDPWCNWQHVWFWFRRVQVRALAGQPKERRAKEVLLFLLVYPRKCFATPTLFAYNSKCMCCAPCVKKKTHHRGTRSYTEKNTPWFSVFSVVKKITTTKCTMLYTKFTQQICILYFHRVPCGKKPHQRYTELHREKYSVVPVFSVVKSFNHERTMFYTKFTKWICILYFMVPLW